MNARVSNRAETQTQSDSGSDGHNTTFLVGKERGAQSRAEEQYLYKEDTVSKG